MALSDETLEQIVSNLTPEEREQLFSQLGRQIQQDKKDISEGKEPLSPSNKPKRTKDIYGNDNIYSFVYCGSTKLKSHGVTSAGNQRYICKGCGKTFTENHGSAMRYSHIDKDTWLDILRGIINNHSTTVIARDTGLVPSTVWLCKQKVCNAIKDMYGYNDLFSGVGEADEYYCRAAFKGKRDAEFFIYTLRRMPHHHRSRKERTEYLDSCNKYRELFENNPSLLREMIYHSQKRMDGTRTIDKNHQHICILTAIDRSNNIYIEPVTSGTANSIDVYNKLQGRISKEAVLVTDEHGSYRYFVRKERIEHIKITGGTYTSGAYSLSRVNSLHSAMDKFISKDMERKPATKYLDLYLMMFWWLQKNKDLSQTQMSELLFHIVTGHVDCHMRANMIPVTIDDLVGRPLPIDTKGFF